MAERKLRSMSRKELIEIIYVLQQSEKALNEKIADLEAKLEERNVILANSGSIAEAVVGLNQIFAVAQKTADDYLASIRASHEAGRLAADQEKL